MRFTKEGRRPGSRRLGKRRFDFRAAPNRIHQRQGLLRVIPVRAGQANRERHALASGDDRPINKIEAYYGQGLTISPDGQTALWSAFTSVNRDLMLIENFR